MAKYDLFFTGVIQIRADSEDEAKEKLSKLLRESDIFDDLRDNLHLVVRNVIKHINYHPIL